LQRRCIGIYLRGSVAKGTAVAGVSDIDTFAVIFGEREAIDRSWIAAFQQRMAVQYLSIPIRRSFALYNARHEIFME